MSEQGPAFDLSYVANLARLELSDEDVAMFEPQLQGILSYMEKLDAIDVSGIEPTAHANPVLNVTRPDEVRPSLPVEEALRNAPKSANDQFVVPKVVE
jgi:aspartyl-tRNA(Asn)/glutamyl-tRNA(Gln) amidotransferase subunit C